MPVSESLNIMSKRVVRRFKHPMAIGLPFTFYIHYNWHGVLVSESLMFKSKGISTLDIKGGSKVIFSNICRIVAYNIRVV